MVEKAKRRKTEKWKSIKIPEALWSFIRRAAAQSGNKFYEEIEQRFK